MYFADIASSLNFGLENCAGWRARSIMAENGEEGNVENEAETTKDPSLPNALRGYGSNYLSRLPLGPVVTSKAVPAANSKLLAIGKPA
jgi:hypothetical protein